MSHIRQKAILGLKTGDTFSVSRTFTQEDVSRFGEISRDYNPVHFEKRFTESKNLEGLVCHGLLVASLLTEIGGQIGWLASGMNMSFKKPVYIGETIRCDFTIAEIVDGGHAKAEVVFTNEKNISVLAAVLTGILPGEGERQVMKEMITEGDPTNKG